LYKIKDLYSGLGQFSWHFASALHARGPGGFDFDFLVPPGVSGVPQGNHFSPVPASFQKRYLPVFNSSYDIWHSLHQFPSHRPKKGAKWILTIHDLNFLREKDDRKAQRYLRSLQKNVDKADVLTTISQFTRSEIEAHIDLKGTPVHVIYNGVDRGISGNNARPAFVQDGKFFFSIGIFSEKKNFKSLLPVMEYFEGHRLIIAGNSETPYGDEIKAEVKRLGLEDRVLLPGKVSEAEKSWLYTHCDAFFFPSLAEGFGMPAIEAMHAGAPVFLSKFTSLPEIGGKAAFYFENFEPDAMASLIAEKLTHIASNRDQFAIEVKRHAATFSWELCIDQYISLYRSLAGHGQSL
jgi:glycosyltransferase involved in cell wall biosynthesis